MLAFTWNIIFISTLKFYIDVLFFYVHILFLSYSITLLHKLQRIMHLETLLKYINKIDTIWSFFGVTIF